MDIIATGIINETHGFASVFLNNQTNIGFSLISMVELPPAPFLVNVVDINGGNYVLVVTLRGVNLIELPNLNVVNTTDLGCRISAT
jgi:hypothetical protein